MRASAFLGVAGIRPFAVDPFEKGKPWTIHPLIDHPHRHKGRIDGGRWSWKLKGELGRWEDR
jgi:hypothetical protein